MLEPLADYIARRKAELTARRDELRGELGPVLAELAEIDSVERARAKARRPSSKTGRARLALLTDDTLKGRILRVLASADRALTSSEILGRVEIEAGQGVDRTTFSPQLSRLCRAGQVVRTGMTYRTPETGADHADRA